VKAAGAKGQLLGCWSSEIGALNQVTVLRCFADDAELQAERWRALSTQDVFGRGDVITELTFDSYAPFPFLPPVKPGKYGSIYEIRTYRLNLWGFDDMGAFEAAHAARDKDPDWPAYLKASADLIVAQENRFVRSVTLTTLYNW